MSRIAAFVAFGLVASASASANVEAQKVSPLTKTIEMLNGMTKKADEEKKAEEVQYASFDSFCRTKIAENQGQVNQEEETLERLSAQIGSDNAQIAKLDRRIYSDEELLTHFEQELAKVKEQRRQEKKDYDQTIMSFAESQKRVDQAVAIVKEQMKPLTEAAKDALLQVKNSYISPAAKKAIGVFLQQDPSDGALLQQTGDPLDQDFVSAAPEARAYESHSDALIEMLDKIKDELKNQRTEAEQKESDDEHSFQQVQAEIEHQIELIKADRSTGQQKESTVIRVKKVEVADWEDTTFMHTTDYADLKSLVANCESKAKVFKERQRLRAEEIEAIKEAVGILSEGTIEKNADKQLNWSLLQKKTVFAQLRATSVSPGQQQVVQYLQQEASRLESHELSALALRVANDPYGKVKKLIKELYTRLKDEASQEEEQSNWCQREISSNKGIRERKTRTLNELQTSADALESEINQFELDRNQMLEDIAEIHADTKEAAEKRESERKENLQEVADAQDAQAAVQRALVVLKSFYEKAASATEGDVSLLQKRKEPFVYKGMQDESIGVLRLLATIESDFARAQAESESAEASAAKEYKDYVLKMREAVVIKQKRADHKAAQLSDRRASLALSKQHVGGTKKELEAAQAYYDTLKPKCLDSGLNYEQRVAARKEEIASLEQALKVFTGQDIA